MNYKSFYATILVIACCLANSCTQEKLNILPYADLAIQTGTVCGWGAGTDSLKITKTQITYMFYIPRKSPTPQILKTRNVSAGEWEEIQSCVQYDEFTTLTWNTCDVCFDGCDEWILIQNGRQSHEIRFSKGMKIDKISRLQNRIAALRPEFRP